MGDCMAKCERKKDVSLDKAVVDHDQGEGYAANIHPAPWLAASRV